jgi:hypothetical protein
MIYNSKIENGCLVLKMIDNNNNYSNGIKLIVDEKSSHIFREFYINIHRGTPYNNIIDSVMIEYKENQIKFEGDNFEFKINKQNEIIDLIDKINTNLMIYTFDMESPKSKL